MKHDLFKTGFGRALALSLASLLLLGCLAGCSQAPGGALMQTPAPTTDQPAQSPAEPPVQPDLTPAPETPAQPEEPEEPVELTPEQLLGRWVEDEGRAELWIQERQGEDLLFSLYIPGSAAINNTLAIAAENGFFFYQDPYLDGVGASGTLRLENGVPVLTFGESRMEFPAGTELRFSRRSEQPSYSTLYAPVTEAYQEHELQGGGLENWYGDEPGYVHVGLTGVDHFGYQFWDLDRDGSPELIIGAIYPEEETAGDEPGLGLYQHNLIVDLYTLVDGAPQYVVNSGDRYRYSLTSDGQIYYEGSGGAAYTDVATYILRGGALEMVNGISSEENAWYNMEDGFNPEHEGYNPIPEEEFLWLFDQFYDLYRYERFAPLQLRPLLVSEA